MGETGFSVDRGELPLDPKMLGIDRPLLARLRRESPAIRVRDVPFGVVSSSSVWVVDLTSAELPSLGSCLLRGRFSGAVSTGFAFLRAS